MKKLIVTLFAALFVMQASYAESMENSKQITVMPVKDISYEKMVDDKAKGKKLVKRVGSEEVHLVKIAPNSSHEQLHAYANDVTIYFLEGESTFIDESGKKQLAKVGDAVFIPANTYFSSITGPKAEIVLLVGDNPDNKIYKSI